MQLHPVLEVNSFKITKMPLCQIRLMDNCLYPWIILVPEHPNVTEIIDLGWDDRLKLMEEICVVSEKMKQIFSPDKLNIAALGNEVSQLHIHIIGRYKSDDAWPATVWGKATKPYTEKARNLMIEHLKPLVYYNDN